MRAGVLIDIGRLDQDERAWRINLLMAALAVLAAGDLGGSIHRQKMKGNAVIICCIHRM